MTTAKKILSICTAALMLAGMTGCSGSTSDSSAADNNPTSSNAAPAADKTSSEAAPAEDSTPANENTEKPASLDTDIVVISREDGSGTRSAFVELMGIEQKNENGDKEDMTREDAEISQSTSVVLQSVKDDVDAIGYVSLGSLNDTVKAVKVDGTEATADNILAGQYKVSRPFVIAVRDGDLSELGADFITFIMSDDGQAIIQQEKYISVGGSGAYTPAGLTGTIVLSGSTSVSPVMEVLADAYKELNSGVEIEVQQTGSGAGITAVTEGACDIGMSSRALKEEELAAGLTATTIANDGIAVIVNLDNPIDNLTSEQIMNIYTGNINNWSELN